MIAVPLILFWYCYHLKPKIIGRIAVKDVSITTNTKLICLVIKRIKRVGVICKSPKAQYLCGFTSLYIAFDNNLITVATTTIILCIRWLRSKGIIVLWLATVKIHMMKPLAVRKFS